MDDEMKPGSGRGEPPAPVGPERPFCLQRPGVPTGAYLVRIDSVVKEPAGMTRHHRRDRDFETHNGSGLGFIRGVLIAPVIVVRESGLCGAQSTFRRQTAKLVTVSRNGAVSLIFWWHSVPCIIQRLSSVRRLSRSDFCSRAAEARYPLSTAAEG